MARTSKPKVEEGSGNVFADLGLLNPEQERLKAHLTLEIYKILKEQGLRQIEAAKLLGTSQPRVRTIRPLSFRTASTLVQKSAISDAASLYS